MCGRYVEERDAEEIAFAFDVRAVPETLRAWRPSWNIAPTQSVPVVVEPPGGTDGSTSGRRLELARWSLTPQWHPTLATPFATFNARSETASVKPTFRDAARRRRALLPATGYYEWVGTGRARRPHFIHLPDGEPMALAGLYSWWADPAAPPDDPARWHLTATMLTSDAVETVADVHDREPVPLPSSWWARWLDPATDGDADLVAEAVAAGLQFAARLVHHEVAPLRGDGPQLVMPVTSPAA